MGATASCAAETQTASGGPPDKFPKASPAFGTCARVGRRVSIDEENFDDDFEADKMGLDSQLLQQASAASPAEAAVSAAAAASSNSHGADVDSDDGRMSEAERLALRENLRYFLGDDVDSVRAGEQSPPRAAQAPRPSLGDSAPIQPPWRCEESSKEEEEVDPEAALLAAFAALRDGRPLGCLPEEMRSNKEVVLAAIVNEGIFCFDYISSEQLRTEDRDVALALVGDDGSILEHLCEELRADREVVSAAVRTCADALRFASPNLQADRKMKALSTSREKEEKRLLKAYLAKCAAKCAPTGCIAR